jgi:hypothetical protein
MRLLELVGGLESEEGQALEQAEGGEGESGEERVGLDEVDERAGELHLLVDGESVEEATERSADEQRYQQTAGDGEPVPGVAPARGTDLVAELDADGPQDQGQDNHEQRQVEGRDRASAAHEVVRTARMLDVARATPWMMADLSVRCAETALEIGDIEIATDLLERAHRALARLPDAGTIPERLARLDHRVLHIDPRLDTLSPAERRILRLCRAIAPSVRSATSCSSVGRPSSPTSAT